jgi:hypothetical protein
MSIIGGVWKKGRSPALAMSLAGGAVLGALSFGLGRLASFAWSMGFPTWLGDVTALALSVFIGAFVVGLYFMGLTILGFASDEGFGPLAHPGYKHFVRLVVKGDGSQIEGYVIGKVDPLDTNGQVVLVDRWKWKNPSFETPSSSPDE